METIKIDNLDEEIKIPAGMIGVVSEAAILSTGRHQIMLVVFPGRPLSPAMKIPGVIEVTGRNLTLLKPDESCTVHISSAYTARRRTVTNEAGVARVERAGVTRPIFGPGTKYWRPEDDKPRMLR